MTNDHEHPANAPEQEITSETPEFAAELAERTVEPSAKKAKAKKRKKADSASASEPGPAELEPVKAEPAEAESVEAEREEQRPQPKLERLQKILAQAGIASRRHAEELITEGRVQVNGQTVTVLGTKADPQRDHIRVDNKLLQGAERLRYFVLNKPKGYVTTVTDPEGRPTVMQFFAKTGQRLYPVGRLDFQSEGLLLVTNDGELANQLTRAASGVEKTYLVKVAGQPDEEQLETLRGGLAIDKGRPLEGKVQTAPARIRQIRKGDNPWYEVVLIEGRNRELRKMFEEIGHHVEKIRRVGYGPLVLDVAPGEIRELNLAEVQALRLTAEGKIKPRRVKSTHMLPKDAGKRVDLEEPKPRRFDRQPDRERPAGGSFERSEGRGPGGRPKFGGRPAAGFDKRSGPSRDRAGGDRPFRTAGGFDKSKGPGSDRAGSDRPFRTAGPRPGPERFGPDRFGGKDEGARGPRREEFKPGAGRPVRPTRGAEAAPRSFEGRRPGSGNRGGESRPRTFEGRKPERREGFGDRSRERSGPQRTSFGGRERPSGADRGQGRGPDRGANRAPDRVPFRSKLRIEPQSEDRPAQSTELRGERKPFGERPPRQETGRKPFQGDRRQPGQGFQKREGSARPFRAERPQSGDPSKRREGFARPSGERRPPASGARREGGPFRGTRPQSAAGSKQREGFARPSGERRPPAPGARREGSAPFRGNRRPDEGAPRREGSARPFSGDRKQGSSYRGKPGGKSGGRPGSRPGGKSGGGPKRSSARPGGKRTFGKRKK